MADKREPFYDVEQIASMTECTGLMPVLPDDEQQDVNYAELYGIHRAKQRRDKRK